MDIRNGLRFFFVSVFFLVSVIVIFCFSFLVFLSQASYLSHNRLFLDFWIFLKFFFSFIKTFLVCFSLCAILNWQLSASFSSANHLPYRIASCHFRKTKDTSPALDHNIVYCGTSEHTSRVPSCCAAMLGQTNLHLPKSNQKHLSQLLLFAYVICSKHCERLAGISA